MWLDKNTKNVIMVHGAGGTGKTQLLNIITAYFRSQNLIVLCTATAGVTALLHDGGVTADPKCKFKLPLDTSDSRIF